MNPISVLGKYLDQPQLVGRFSKTVPAILIAGGGVYTFNNTFQAPEGEKRKEFIKSIAVMIGTISSALIATRGIGKIKIGKNFIFKGFEGLSEKINLKEIKKAQIELIDEFLKTNNTLKSKGILEKVKENGKNIFNFSEIRKIFEELDTTEEGKTFLNKLIPNPENIDSKHIFGEIKRLSLMGLIPVLGGITGGIAGDRLTEKNWKEKIPDKIKEGSYQYLANIFLCNIGAGAALWTMEKAKISSKSVRAVGMIGGITLAGVVFGSAIANLFGKICIDPLLHHKDKNHVHHHKDLYSERTPELLDVGLHIDDVATIAVMSGLKWIEPALPILYAVSGYRAGIGYRNS